MIFSFKSQHNTSQNKNTIINRQNNIASMPIVLPQTRSISRNVVEQPAVTDTNKPKKMKWGEPTWYLFHALAEKVKEERFSSIRGELLNTIYVICKNLPCPLCANHATQYMNAINFNTIQTKKDLIDLLWNFHNEVNKRKNFPIFPYEQLAEKYSKANLINIIQVFMVHFKDKHASLRMIADDMYRQQISRKMQDWFRQNIQSFDA
jgi:hypothetical protein